MVRGKDMEHMSMLIMEPDTLGSGCRMTSTGMEYTDGQIELYIKDNSNRIMSKVMHIEGWQVATSIMDSGRIIISTEMELNKRMASYTESNIKMTTLQVKRNSDSVIGFEVIKCK